MQGQLCFMLQIYNNLLVLWKYQLHWNMQQVLDTMTLV